MIAVCVASRWTLPAEATLDHLYFKCRLLRPDTAFSDPKRQAMLKALMLSGNKRPPSS